MWFPVSAIVAIFILCDIIDGMNVDNDLELVFSGRTHSDWKDAWHKEKFSRCRQTLVRHLYWACEKDIYRLTRRSNPPSFKNYYEEDVRYPWLVPSKAKRFLRFRRSTNRRSGSSITNECCKSSGCTWEEYAEYCPTNKRYTTYV